MRHARTKIPPGSPTDENRLRLVVMNGHRLLQAEMFGKWRIVSTDKAGALKPALYNLFSAIEPDKTQMHVGQIVHIGSLYVYQVIGEGTGMQRRFVKHLRADFDRLPNDGSDPVIIYNKSGRAVVR